MFLGICACSGETSSVDASESANPPEVSGFYTCQNNCSDTDCVYSSIIEVDQDESDITVYSDAGTFEGEIDSHGNFSVGDNTQECSGDFDGDTFTVVCESTDGSVSCPEATFISQWFT